MRRVYFPTLVARALISATLLWLLLTTGDPFFAVILVIVLVGVALTGANDLLDRRDGARPWPGTRIRGRGNVAARVRPGVLIR